MGFELMNGQGEIVGAHRTYLSHTWTDEWTRRDCWCP